MSVKSYQSRLMFLEVTASQRSYIFGTPYILHIYLFIYLVLLIFSYRYLFITGFVVGDNV